MKALENNKVVIAEHHTHYDGSRIIGLFSTREKALIIVKKEFPKGKLDEDGDWDIPPSNHFEGEWVSIWEEEIDIKFYPNGTHNRN